MVNARIFNQYCLVECSIALFVVLISMHFCAAPKMVELPVCTDDGLTPCILRNSKTIDVCAGDPANSSMALNIGNDMIISPEDIEIYVVDSQFSKGLFVSGEFHFGDEQIDRWRNNISFEGNTVIYDIWNSGVLYQDEFECHMEINVRGERFKSDPFKWFDVENCTSENKPSCLKQRNQEEQLEELKTLYSQLQSRLQDIAETIDDMKNRITSSEQVINNKLDRLMGLCISIIVLLVLLIIMVLTAVIIYLRRKDNESRTSSDVSNSNISDIPLSSLQMAPEDEAQAMV